MDQDRAAGRREAVHGSHESLAASSPSNSIQLGGTGQQARGAAFVDPDDVEVNLEGQHGAWGEENDILTYVQSKVCVAANACHLVCRKLFLPLPN